MKLTICISPLYIPFCTLLYTHSVTEYTHQVYLFFQHILCVPVNNVLYNICPVPAYTFVSYFSIYQFLKLPC